MEIIFGAYAVLLGLMGGLVYRAELAAWLFKPATGSSGTFVAEVWLDWEVCRGSTLYRQRFGSLAQATRYVTAYARLLDLLLPAHYSVTDRRGRVVPERYNYAIRYGVRAITDPEKASFRSFLSVGMPGGPLDTGEHASAHPLLRT